MSITDQKTQVSIKTGRYAFFILWPIKRQIFIGSEVGKFCENFSFLNSIKRHVCHIKNL